MPTVDGHYVVTRSDADYAHERALEHGGLTGLLNENALESSLARPYDGYHTQIHEKVAALVHAIISSHPFVDGNKRTAFQLMQLVVQRSGYVLRENSDATRVTILRVAANEVSYSELEKWLRARLHLHKRS